MVGEVAALVRAVDGLSTVDPRCLTDVEIGSVVPALLRVRARLDAVLTGLVGQADARRVPAAQGYGSTVGWLRGAGVDPAAAAQLVATARRLPDLPATAAAFTAGQIDLAAAAAVAGATRYVSVEALREHLEPVLLDVARETDASVVRRAVRRARFTLAPAVTAAEAETASQRRWVDLHETAFGCYDLSGVLDQETAEGLRVAFAAYGRPAGPTDDRTAGQRRHDALSEIVRRALRCGELPDSGGERPRITVTVDLAALASGVGAGQLGWTGPVGIETVRRLGCDAELTRVVFGPAGEVLDLGRVTRIPSSAQRRALVARDGGCVFPDCTRPAAWCDAHHLRSWADGGPSDLANLALLCRFHHRRVHESGWTLTTDTNGGWIATGPDQRHLHRRRRTTA